MANFAAAIPHVLAHEGGFVNDPKDPGGATNYGISLRWLSTQGLLGDFDADGDVDADDIRKMTRAQATEIYRTKWWNAYGYGSIDSQAVATKVFDLSVNMGPKQAHKLLQRALNRLGQPLTADGILGPKTLRATNQAKEHVLLAHLRDEAGNFYTDLANRRPELSKFLRGWLRRAMA